MASETDIVNVAMTLLGESRIMSMSDNAKPAREAKAIFEITRDALLAGYTWSFAKTRVQLSALANAPLFDYQYKYQLPADCLRIVAVGQYHVGLDMSDYRGKTTREFEIEGRELLTNLTAPLNLRYIKRTTDTTLFAACFTKAFAAKIAADLAEPLTQSETKRARATAEFDKEISLAIRSGAIELAPDKLASDEWLVSRL